MRDEMTLTYQTRLKLNAEEQLIFQEYATLLSHVERSLYAEITKGKTASSCKNDFLKIHGITARQFNGCRVSLDGKISACKSGIIRAIRSLKEQLDSIDKNIKKL
jgi:hypothetical protein